MSKKSIKNIIKKKYASGGDIGTVAWTGEVINEANAFFDLIGKTYAESLDYLKYIYDTLRALNIKAKYQDAEKYYRDWLLANEEILGRAAKMGGKYYMDGGKTNYQTGGKIGIPDIIQVLKNNPFYIEHRLFSFTQLAPLVDLVIKEYLKYDRDNPIVTRFNESVFFEPSKIHIEREGIDKAKIEYAIRFITGDTYVNKEKKRQYDKSKFDALQLLITALNAPDVQRLYQKEDKSKNRKSSIVYAKEFSINKGICIILIAEISKEGAIRAVAFLPKDKCGYIEKQKAADVWSDAPVFFSPFTEKPPFNKGQTKAVGGNINSRSSYYKYTKNINRNSNNLIKLYNSDCQLVMEVPLGEFAENMGYVYSQYIEKTESTAENSIVKTEFKNGGNIDYKVYSNFGLMRGYITQWEENYIPDVIKWIQTSENDQAVKYLRLMKEEMSKLLKETEIKK